MRFSNSFWWCSFLQFWHPQNHLKKYHNSLKEVWHQTNYCHCLKYMLRFLKKLRFKFFLSHLLRFLRLCSYLQFLAPQKITQKIITNLWKRCGIRKIYFHFLKYMLRVLKNCGLSSFSHICESFWGNAQFEAVSTQKTPEIYHRFLKLVWHCLNLLAYFRVYNKISEKNLI